MTLVSTSQWHNNTSLLSLRNITVLLIEFVTSLKKSTFGHQFSCQLIIILTIFLFQSHLHSLVKYLVNIHNVSHSSPRDSPSSLQNLAGEDKGVSTVASLPLSSLPPPFPIPRAGCQINFLKSMTYYTSSLFKNI